MLVEHSFVTTLDEAAAVGRAKTFLESLGFSFVGNSSGKEALFKRGGNRIAARVHFGNLPQQVHVSYDRGRMDVAASIHEHRKVDPIHRNLVMAVVLGLEATVTESQPLEAARREFDMASDQAETRSRRRRRNSLILWGILALFLVGVVAFITYAINT